MNAIYSELHSRLNHLVNYSSQLIFVSSESIAEQHRTLEAFMADQNEQTEVAFVTAQPQEQVVSYRRQLCRQLIGQVAGSFVRPLNELLVSLNHHDGPVLIGITQAHHLPNSFLQELWDLVLQSRFAANRQHLNIVLFGSSNWAEQAQAWLPAKNTATPLLLSSESIENVQTDLEQLIAQKRAAFQQRISERNNIDDTGEKVALIRKPWFSLLVIALFSVFFVALLSWQYPQKMRELVGLEASNIDAPITVESQSLEVAAPPSKENPIEVAAAFESQSSEIAELSKVNESDVLTTADTTGDTKDSTAEISAGEQQTTSTADALLVTNWQTRENNSQESALSESEAIPETAAAVEEPLPTSATSSDWPALPALEGSQFLIQLAGLQNIDLAMQFIEDQRLENNVWLYQTQRYGGDWYVIVFNKTYASLDEARIAITQQLPSYQSQSPPFVKSAQQINNELNL